MSSSSGVGVDLGNFVIPLEEILLATQNFSPETRISGACVCDIYRGQLEKRTVAIDRCRPNHYLGDGEFYNELKIISRLHHQNIIGFIGYCDEGDHRITVSEYAVNGCLDQHLEDRDKRRSLTWTHRLNICIGAAKGLEYLHSGRGEDNIVIHRDVKSSNILLDDNLEAKICNFSLSLLVEGDQPVGCDGVEGTTYYLDPVYEESRCITTGSDIYSFGVVLFEMLSGMLAYRQRSIDGDQPQKLIKLVRRYYNQGLYSLIDPDIRDQITMRSFNVFKETAYQCISWNLRDRPTISIIIKSLEQALDFQNHRASSKATIQSLQYEDLTSFQIPLEEITLATRHFSSETRIGESGFGVVYKGRLSNNWQNRIAVFKRLDHNRYHEKEFVTELNMMSSFKHENILPFIGYCDEGNEMIIVSEFATNQSLDYHLRDPNKSCCLTWAQRFKICIGAAKGLEYLHSGLGENGVVIHRNMSSTKILLDDNLETKISGFDLSLLVNRNEPQVYVTPVVTHFYIDPIYKESGMVNTGSDVYSFGVVLFEMLSGMPAYHQRSIDDGRPQTLLNLVKRYYDDGQLDKLIDPFLKDQIDNHSFYTFTNIAYRCISMNVNDRPTMKRIIKRIEEALNFQNHRTAYSITTPSLESYKIPLEEINLATGNFNPHSLIGEGGFGVVYKGQLSQSWQNCTVAIKRLNPKSQQGKKEFHTEINLISRFHHPNIIPFVGYCDEHNQMIIVYQYAVNRSLDYYLVDRDKMRSLTWAQRLKICLGAAKGLDYLHSGLRKHHRVIHRDVKSANILLDEHLEAKICDFGLSTEGPRNQESSHIFTKVASTNFYMDPIYYGSGILRKESDVYSFSVVLFEMLSGRPAYHQIEFVDGNPQHLINLVRYYYENAPEKLIDPDIRDQIDSRSFHTFREIAYQCISFISKERPTMDKVIDKIEDAIEFQELKA